jgi:hypothetical protein
MKFTPEQSKLIVAAVLCWMFLMISCYVAGFTVHNIGGHSF